MLIDLKFILKLQKPTNISIYLIMNEQWYIDDIFKRTLMTTVAGMIPSRGDSVNESKAFSALLRMISGFRRYL